MKYKKRLNEIDVITTLKEIKTNSESFIFSEEERFHKEVRDICNHCIINNIEIILLCGPSAAGKTTTSKIMERNLTHLGHGVNRLSLDNFYKSKELLPFWDDGERNLESIDGIDVELFTELVNKLFDEGESIFPVFEFNDTESTRSFKLRHDPGSLLIIEGIHALHPRIYQAVQGMRCCRVYISTHSNYVGNNKILLPARMLRLVRRIIRDEKHRFAPIEMTLNMWKYIQKGEELYIYPYRHLSDYHIDTAHAYEPYLYSKQLRSLLIEIPDDVKQKNLVSDLSHSASEFEDFILAYDQIPETSLIQEFIK